MHTAQYCNCVHTTYYYLVCRYNYIQAQIIFLFIYIPLLKQFLKNEWIQIIKFHKNVKVTQSEIVSFFVHSNFSQLCPFHGVYSFIYYWTVITGPMWYPTFYKGWTHCFHMEVKMAVLNTISQNCYKISDFFEVKLVPYASLCLGKYLDRLFMRFWVDRWPFYLTEPDE